MSTRENESILITGATGFVGGLVAATLIKETDSRLVLPIRPHHSREALLEPIVAELEAAGHSPSSADLARIVSIELPRQENLSELVPTLKTLNVGEIIHCAACLSYFDTELLEEINVGLTDALLEVGRRLEVRRFIHVSTAFACGYGEKFVREALHPEPPADPNDYTRTKRIAEHHVAKSGLPYLILRPSVVIGHSQDGRYHGKLFGLYQVWDTMARLLGDRYHEEMHLLAPKAACQFVHQDALQAAFLAAYRTLPPGAIVHLVSGQKHLPTARQLIRELIEQIAKPKRVYYYETMEDLPLTELDPQQRLCAELISSNVNIANYDYQFETRNLDRFKEMGIELADVTFDTVEVCEKRFMEESPVVRRSIELHKHFAEARGTHPIETIEVAHRNI